MQMLYALICMGLGHLAIRLFAHLSNMVSRRVNTSENRAQVEDLYERFKSFDTLSQGRKDS